MTQSRRPRNAPCRLRPSLSSRAHITGWFLLIAVPFPSLGEGQQVLMRGPLSRSHFSALVPALRGGGHGRGEGDRHVVGPAAGLAAPGRAHHSHGYVWPRRRRRGRRGGSCGGGGRSAVFVPAAAGVVGPHRLRRAPCAAWGSRGSSSGCSGLQPGQIDPWACGEMKAIISYIFLSGHCIHNTKERNLNDRGIRHPNSTGASQAPILCSLKSEDAALR